MLSSLFIECAALDGCVCFHVQKVIILIVAMEEEFITYVITRASAKV
ncbi:MAG: hypothetical protein Q4D14_07530 [Bacteroidales bacterium]|nr:hypothetical protein [Bacteroidales bacterium]